MVPSSVPNAIVYTGMPASAASWRAVGREPADGRLTVAEQHHHAGRDVGVLGVGRVHEQPGPGRRARRRSRSTRRVRGCRSRSPSRCDRASGRRRRSPDRRTRSARPRRSGRPGRRSPVAASWAATNRVGSTSSASIDSDTSNNTRMRPSLVVRSVSRSTGRAMAITAAVSPSSWTPATTWRRQRGRCRRDPVEQVDLGEANRRRPAPPQHDDVQHGECRRDDRAASRSRKSDSLAHHGLSAIEVDGAREPSAP